MGQKEEQFSELIGLIYETAMSPDMWPALLHSIADYTDSKAAVFRVSNVINDDVYMGFTYGHDKSYLESYRDYYIHIDPFRPAQAYTRTLSCYKNTIL